MMDDFQAAEIDTGETTIFVSSYGSGPPLLLLHGFPQTHLMWRGVAPVLARRFSIVCADLRGYGRSGCPASTPDHAPYAKRAMARDMIVVMENLGYRQFAVRGHDRGGRVGYRMALDYPEHITRLAMLDILPIEAAWELADARLLAVVAARSTATPVPSLSCGVLEARLTTGTSSKVDRSPCGGDGVTALKVAPSKAAISFQKPRAPQQRKLWDTSSARAPSDWIPKR